MVKILLLKNGPVVLLSYLLNFIGESSDKQIWVLAHEHAVENVRTLQYVAEVIPYRARTILEYRHLECLQRRDLKQQKFSKVYFLINPDQQTGFENLLNIARRLVAPGGAVIGMTSQGEEIVFSPRLLKLIRQRQLISNLLAAGTLAGLVLAAPLLMLGSLLRWRRQKEA